jgi:histidyl-tRNA synthetase
LSIFKKLELEPLLQISNINIPHKISKMLGISLDAFRHINVEQFLAHDIEWLTKLVYLHDIEQIDEVIAIVPDEIKVELEKIKELCSEISYTNVVIAPMYYAAMLYYDELFFRVIHKNEIYARGGRYHNDDVTSVGFAIYTDTLVEALS